MIYNKKINRIKDLLSVSVSRQCDATIPYEYAEELYKLLNNIETVRTREVVSEYADVDDDIVDYVKKYLAEDMSSFLNEENCIKMRSYKDKYIQGTIYEGELLVIKPMEKENL